MKDINYPLVETKRPPIYTAMKYWGKSLITFGAHTSVITQRRMAVFWIHSQVVQSPHLKLLRLSE